MIDDKEKDLIQTLYLFYVGKKMPSKGDLSDGDFVDYIGTDSRFVGKTGIYKGKRTDGKMKINFGSSSIYVKPDNVSKIEKEEKSGSPNKGMINLLKHLNQMVADGDLSRGALDQFVRELNFKNSKKEIDPYDEENWDEVELDLLKNLPKGLGKQRHSGHSFERTVTRQSDYRGC